MDYKVIDYNFSGKLYLPLAEAVNIIFTILIILFLIISIIFTVNLVMLSIIKRRKEIGINITMGLGKTENILLFLGEIAFILTLSWVIGAVIGTGLIILFSKIGMPGMFFFVNNTLFFLFDINHLFIVYLILMPTALLAALVPSLSIYKLDTVVILQESN
ncbi:MAG: FtsX-like permease family protein [bacterium]